MFEKKLKKRIKRDPGAVLEIKEGIDYLHAESRHFLTELDNVRKREYTPGILRRLHKRLSHGRSTIIANIQNAEKFDKLYHDFMNPSRE